MDVYNSKIIDMYNLPLRFEVQIDDPLPRCIKIGQPEHPNNLYIYMTKKNKDGILYHNYGYI